MATFVVAHGAWSGGWVWRKMRPLMRAAGHDLYTPTYTGLGARTHLAHPDIDLNTHIEDVTTFLFFEGLRDVILVGHSYGGMVATGVADRMGHAIGRLVYLDAFVPEDGECLFDLVPPEHAKAMQAKADAEGDGWRIPPNPISPDTSDADRMWLEPRHSMQPIKTFQTKIRIANGPFKLPRHYIRCRQVGPDDVFLRFYDRAVRESWGTAEIDASHSPNASAPEALMSLLDAIAAEGG